jgi:hypothetical protein
MTKDFIAQRVAEGLREPLGIPAYFLADQLARGGPAARVLCSVRSVASEYAGAEGYAAEWGQIVEQTFGHFVAWRFVPVAWWDRLHSVRQQSTLLIPDLIDVAQRSVIASISDRLAEGVVISGQYPNGRRHPHSLLTLVLVVSPREQAVRHWIGAEFLPRQLPQALARGERRLRELLRDRHRAAVDLARKAT